MRRVAEALETIDARTLEDDTLLGRWLVSRVSSSSHPTGTCRLGSPRDERVVVDAALRVYDVEGLRVADASVIPVSPRANPKLTSIAIGERAADILLGRT
jgi:choline dehydrogenase-like flavoprotein